MEKRVSNREEKRLDKREVVFHNYLFSKNGRDRDIDRELDNRHEF